jgi:hypothetical protein
MLRDQEEFGIYWELTAFQARVQYHTGIDFESSLGDLFIFDEADTFILDNTDSFVKFTRNNSCICMTASPDDQDESGVEKKMIDTMGYKRCYSNDKAGQADTKVAFDMELQAKTTEDVISFIQ